MFIFQYKDFFYFLVKKANASRIQEVCHVSDTFSGFSLGKM